MGSEGRRRYRCRYCGNVQRLLEAERCPCGGTLTNYGRNEIQRLFGLDALVVVAHDLLHLTENQVRDLVGANTATWDAVTEGGLTFDVADRWSIALELHPLLVWGQEWLDHAMNDWDRAEVAFWLLARHEGLVA